MKKLILVSNRLPLTVSGSGSNVVVKPGDGGLATAVGRVSKKRQARWVGSLMGEETSPDVIESLRKQNYYPVSMARQTYRRYYTNFSNRVLWPVLHGLRPFASHKSYWSDYVAANEAFADEVAAVAGPDDVIWVHDYHLFLLPEMLRTRGLTNKIGFFLHTPFPDKSFFSDTAPGRRILRSLLMADSLGVQTNRYLKKLQSAMLAAGAMVSATSSLVAYRNHVVKAGAFPIGIDYQYFSRKPDRQLQFMERVGHKFDSKIILSLSRLDYTKGLPELLRATRMLLQDPASEGRFVLRLCVIPSREAQPEYQELKRDIEDQVQDLNRTYATDNWTPVEYRYGTLKPDELLATYRQADIFIAPSVADGMNLVAKEYLAANTKGVLVLGRGTGAAEQLADAVLVDGVSPADIARGLSMSLSEVSPRATARRLRKIVRTENVFTWADTFLGTL